VSQIVDNKELSDLKNLVEEFKLKKENGKSGLDSLIKIIDMITKNKDWIEKMKRSRKKSRVLWKKLEPFLLKETVSAEETEKIEDIQYILITFYNYR